MVACIWRKLRGINLKLGNAGKGSCDRNWSINQVVLAHIPKMFHNPVFYFGGSALEINQKFKQPIYRKNTIKPTENRFHAIHFSLAIYLARWSAYQIKTGSHMQAFCQTAYQQWIFCGQNLGLLKRLAKLITYSTVTDTDSEASTEKKLLAILMKFQNYLIYFLSPQHIIHIIN